MTTNARKWRFTRLTLAATALLVAGGVGEATGAVTAVQRALLADNAVKVDGIKASRKPRGNYLVPLAKDGRFPASTMNPDAAPGRTYYGVLGFEGTAPAGTLPDKNGFMPTTATIPDPADATKTITVPAATTGTLPYFLGTTVTVPFTAKGLKPGDVGITGGGIESPDCEGTYARPTANPGAFCIYPGPEEDDLNTPPGDISAAEAEVFNVFRIPGGELNLEVYPYQIGVGTTGFRVEGQANGPGPVKFFARWAYTPAA